MTFITNLIIKLSNIRNKLNTNKSNHFNVLFQFIIITFWFFNCFPNIFSCHLSSIIRNSLVPSIEQHSMHLILTTSLCNSIRVNCHHQHCQFWYWVYCNSGLTYDQRIRRKYIFFNGDRKNILPSWSYTL